MAVTNEFDLDEMRSRFGTLTEGMRKSTTQMMILGVALLAFVIVMLGFVYLIVTSFLSSRRRRNQERKERAAKHRKITESKEVYSASKNLRISTPTQQPQQPTPYTPTSSGGGGGELRDSSLVSWDIPGAPRDEAHMDVSTVEPWILRLLDQYDVHAIRGFLPAEDPITRLPMDPYAPWENLSDDLAKLLCARLGQARPPLRSLVVISTDELTTTPMLKRAHLLLSLFAHAYVWGGEEPEDFIPEGIAVPLWEVSRRLDIPPVLGHPSVVLYNWRRLDKGGAICMENIATLNHFFGSRDESWFYLITVEIEARGAKSVVPLMLCVDAIQRALELLGDKDKDAAAAGDGELSEMQRLVRKPEEGGLEMARKTDRNGGSHSKSGYAIEELLPGPSSQGLSGLAVCCYLTDRLRIVNEAVRGMAESMVLMREGCHPFIFYHRVRPFLSAWKQNPTLPNGVLYRGVSNVRQQFYGGSAAQSALIPFLDIMLGINHKSTKSRIFLQAMREYMHKQHREFLGYVEQVACLREFVMAGVEFHLGGKGGKSKQEATGKKDDGGEGSDEDLTEEQQAWADLRTIYDLCVLGMKEFRSGHINVVAEYIVAQNQKGKTGGFEESAGGKGTGGTDLMKFLKPLRNNCHQATSTDFDFGGVCPMTGAVGECPAASFASGPSASVDDTATNATADDDNLSTYSEVSEMSEAASSVNVRPRATSKTPEREGDSNESTEPSWARSPANPEESGRAAVKAAMLAASEAPVPEYVHVKDNAAKGEIDLYNTKIEHLERDNSAEEGQ